MMLRFLKLLCAVLLVLVMSGCDLLAPSTTLKSAQRPGGHTAREDDRVRATPVGEESEDVESTTAPEPPGDDADEKLEDTSGTTGEQVADPAPVAEPDDQQADGYPGCSGTRVPSGADLQPVLDGQPQGTTFCLESGTYRVSTALRPKPAQVIMAIERRGATLNGGHTARMAFNGDAIAGVTIRGLVIESFETPNQGGLAAVKAGDRWTIVDNEIRNNASTGLYHGSDVVVRGNYIHHNGVIGLGGFQSSGALVVGNEVAYNAVSSDVADSGGSKWVGTRNLTVRDNYFHHNGGTGIWLDGDNINAVIENNRSNYNVGHDGGKGFQYEISCAGVVRNNTAVGNEHAALELVASRDVEVYGNRFADNGYGIRVWHQQRDGGSNCEWSLGNVRIYDNAISMRTGYTGVLVWNAPDGDAIFDSSDSRVRFWGNNYELLGDDEAFHWRGALRTLREWQQFGHDN